MDEDLQRALRDVAWARFASEHTAAVCQQARQRAVAYSERAWVAWVATQSGGREAFERVIEAQRTILRDRDAAGECCSTAAVADPIRV